MSRYQDITQISDNQPESAAQAENNAENTGIIARLSRFFNGDMGKVGSPEWQAAEASAREKEAAAGEGERRLLKQMTGFDNAEDLRKANVPEYAKGYAKGEANSLLDTANLPSEAVQGALKWAGLRDKGAESRFTLPKFAPEADNVDQNAGMKMGREAGDWGQMALGTAAAGPAAMRSGISLASRFAGAAGGGLMGGFGMPEQERQANLSRYRELAGKQERTERENQEFNALDSSFNGEAALGGALLGGAAGLWGPRKLRKGADGQALRLDPALDAELPRKDLTPEEQALGQILREQRGMEKTPARTKAGPGAEASAPGGYMRRSIDQGLATPEQAEAAFGAFRRHLQEGTVDPAEVANSVLGEKRFKPGEITPEQAEALIVREEQSVKGSKKEGEAAQGKEQEKTDFPAEYSERQPYYQKRHEADEQAWKGGMKNYADQIADKDVRAAFKDLMEEGATGSVAEAEGKRQLGAKKQQALLDRKEAESKAAKLAHDAAAKSLAAMRRLDKGGSTADTRAALARAEEAFARADKRLTEAQYSPEQYKAALELAAEYMKDTARPGLEHEPRFYFNPMEQYSEQSGALRGAVDGRTVSKNAALPEELPYQRGAWRFGEDLRQALQEGRISEEAARAAYAEQAERVGLKDSKTGTGKARTPEEQALGGRKMQEGVEDIIAGRGQPDIENNTPYRGPVSALERQFIADLVAGRENGGAGRISPEAASRIKEALTIQGGESRMGRLMSALGESGAGSTAGTFLGGLSGPGGALAGKVMGDMIDKGLKGIAGQKGAARSRFDTSDPLGAGLAFDKILPELAEAGIEARPMTRRPVVAHAAAQTAPMAAMGSKLGANSGAANADNTPAAGVADSAVEQGPKQGKGDDAGGGEEGKAKAAKRPKSRIAALINMLTPMLAGAIALKTGGRFNPLIGDQAQELTERYPGMGFTQALALASNPEQLNQFTSQMAMYGQGMSPQQFEQTQKLNGHLRAMDNASRVVDSIEHYTDAVGDQFAGVIGEKKYNIMAASPWLQGKSGQVKVLVGKDDNGKNIYSEMNAFDAETQRRQLMSLLPGIASQVYNSGLGTSTDASRAAAAASHAKEGQAASTVRAWANELRSDIGAQSDWVKNQQKQIMGSKVGRYGGLMGGGGYGSYGSGL